MSLCWTVSGCWLGRPSALLARHRRAYWPLRTLRPPSDLGTKRLVILARSNRMPLVRGHVARSSLATGFQKALRTLYGVWLPWSGRNHKHDWG